MPIEIYGIDRKISRTPEMQKKLQLAWEKRYHSRDDYLNDPRLLGRNYDFEWTCKIVFKVGGSYTIKFEDALNAEDITLIVRALLQESSRLEIKHQREIELRIQEKEKKERIKSENIIYNNELKNVKEAILKASDFKVDEELREYAKAINCTGEKQRVLKWVEWVDPTNGTNTDPILGKRRVGENILEIRPKNEHWW